MNHPQLQDRVKFRHILLKQEDSEGVVLGFTPQGGEFQPALLTVGMDRGFVWTAPLEDWVLVQRHGIVRRLVDFIRGK